MKTLIVFGTGHAPASGGDDETRLLAQIVEHPAFHIPEGLLTVFRNDGGDGTTVGFFQNAVCIHKGAVQAFGEKRAYGGFSAAGHADENDILHLAAKLPIDGINYAVVQFFSREPFGTFFGLGNQHFETIYGRQTQLFRVQEYGGPGRIVGQIQDCFQIWKLGQIVDDRIVHVGIHSHRSGVDDQGGIRVPEKIAVVVFAGT